jgi:hypothetical protein
MGTRSRIGVMHGDKCKSIYCHWDGYLDYNGKILLEHYDSAKANHLVALGDISSLDRNVEIPEGVRHTFDEPAKGITTFYGRDRKENGCEFAVDHTFEDFMKRVDGCGAEYYYIMRDGVWYVGNNYGSDSLSGKLVPLSEAFADELIEEEIRTWETVDL